MAGSPTVRSLAEMRKRGYTVAKTEHFNSFIKQRFDLFGFIDILCIKEGEKDVGLQTTSTSNVTSRIAKIQSLPHAITWLKSGHRILVQGWAKRGARGARKLWTLMERELVWQDGAISEIIHASQSPVSEEEVDRALEQACA